MAKSTAGTKSKPKGKRKPRTVEFDLSVNVDFGDDYGKVNVIDDRRVPFTGTIFSLRSKVIPGLAGVIFKAASLRPQMIRDMLVVPTGSFKRLVPGSKNEPEDD